MKSITFLLVVLSSVLVSGRPVSAKAPYDSLLRRMLDEAYDCIEDGDNCSIKAYLGIGLFVFTGFAFLFLVLMVVLEGWCKGQIL